MKLSNKFDKALISITVITAALLFGCLLKVTSAPTFAEGDESTYTEVSDKHVTFYDEGKKLTVKTDAATVADAIERANIIINDGDIVEPKLDASIDMDNFFINIYRAHPVLVRDGAVDKYIMTASYDLKTIASEAGITIYDGDEIKPSPNTNFLEAGATTIYEVTRNGGRTVTVEQEIPFAEKTEESYDLEPGTKEVKQLGEVGTKRINYNVLYVDGKEVSREVISEEIIRNPVDRITVVGVKKPTPSIRPEAATCAEWARQAGVSEADLAAAIDLIYHESGCRVNATNASSGAYGIPQALPGAKMASAGADWETNPVTQIRWMAGYVSRYGGWQGAINFWYAHGWY